MAKLVRLDKHYYPSDDYGHWCPGCGYGHEISVDRPNASGAKWTFNGDPKNPSFLPSINLQVNPKGHKHYNPDACSSVCHYFVRLGRELQRAVPTTPLRPDESYIHFLGDCTHALRGQIVPLPDVPDGKYPTSERL